VVEEAAVVLDRQHGFIHQLNRTATYIWERCEGNASIEAIAAQLAETFAVEYETALDDVVRVMRDFQHLQLLEVFPQQPLHPHP
jgi:coenzyme PQQ synthesis protein D (PqqD)